MPRPQCVHCTVRTSRPDIRYVYPPSTVPVGGVLNYETCTPVVRLAGRCCNCTGRLNYDNIGSLAFRTVPYNVNCKRSKSKYVFTHNVKLESVGNAWRVDSVPIRGLGVNSWAKEGITLRYHWMLYQEAYHDDATFRGNMMLRGAQRCKVELRKVLHWSNSRNIPRGGQGYQDVKGCSAMHRRAVLLRKVC